MRRQWHHNALPSLCGQHSMPSEIVGSRQDGPHAMGNNFTDCQNGTTPDWPYLITTTQMQIDRIVICTYLFLLVPKFTKGYTQFEDHKRMLLLQISSSHKNLSFRYSHSHAPLSLVIWHLRNIWLHYYFLVRVPTEEGFERLEIEDRPSARLLERRMLFKPSPGDKITR